MKNSLKQFFGPTWGIAIIKIILGLGVYFAVFYIQGRVFFVDYENMGLPFKVLKEGICVNTDPYIMNSYIIKSSCSTTNYFTLILDGVFWYAVTNLIINLLRKGNKN